MLSIFFINPLGCFDPKKPIPFGKTPHTKPTRDREEPEDFDDNLEENCLVCGKQNGVHTSDDFFRCRSMGENQ